MFLSSESDVVTDDEPDEIDPSADVADSLEEPDIPPAGTRCCICHAAGHFCQATEYCQGDSGNCICKSCLEGKDCPVLALRKHPVKDDGTPLDKAPALDRNVVATPPKTSKLISVDNHKPQQREPQQQREPRSWKQPERAKATALLLAGATRREAVEQSGLSRATIDNICKEHNLTNPSGGSRGPGGRKLGTLSKPVEREAVRKLLLEGKSVRETAAEIGVATGTVRSVRAELPDLPRADSGGAPKHKFRGGASGKPRDENLREEIRETLDQGASVRQAAELIGCSTNTVQAVKREESAVEPQQPLLLNPIHAMPPTLSRAFELVIRELNNDIDRLEDVAERDGVDRDTFLAEAIATNKQLVSDLEDWHPAIMGSTAGSGTTAYQRALDVSSAELRVIEMEIVRLIKRRDALKPVVEALRANIDVIADTQ